MKLYTFLNNCTRKLELLLISSVHAFYMINIYATLNSSHMIIPLYLLLVSLYYYVAILIKQPSTLQDIHCEIKGLCKKCNRVVSNKTVHCEICNKCIYKRDHHCIVTGKCIEPNNMLDLFYAILFFFLYSCISLYQGSTIRGFGFIYKFFAILSFAIMSWMIFLILIDKTTSEYLKGDTQYKVKYQRLSCLVQDGIFSVLFPFLKKNTRLIE